MLKIILLLLFLGQGSDPRPPYSFQKRVNQIAAEYCKYAIDPMETQRLFNEAKSLLDSVWKAKELKNEYTAIQIDSLEDIHEELNTLKFYIGATGLSEQYVLSRQNLLKSNSLSGGKMVIVPGKQCLPSYFLALGKYRCFLIYNDEENMKGFSFTVCDSLNNILDSGTTQLWSNSYIMIWNNRSQPGIKKVTVNVFNCNVVKY
jgi:hypothetical protein